MEDFSHLIRPGTAEIGAAYIGPRTTCVLCGRAFLPGELVTFVPGYRCVLLCYIPEDRDGIRAHRCWQDFLVRYHLTDPPSQALFFIGRSLS